MGYVKNERIDHTYINATPAANGYVVTVDSSKINKHPCLTINNGS